MRALIPYTFGAEIVTGAMILNHNDTAIRSSILIFAGEDGFISAHNLAASGSHRYTNNRIRLL